MKLGRIGWIAVGICAFCLAVAIGLAATSGQWGIDRIGLVFVTILGVILLVPALWVGVSWLGQSTMGFFGLLGGWLAGWKFREIQAFGWRFIRGERPFREREVSWAFSAFWFVRDTGKVRGQLPYVLPVVGGMVAFFGLLWAFRNVWYGNRGLPIIMFAVGLLSELRRSQDFLSYARMIRTHYAYFLDFSRFEEWGEMDHGFGQRARCPALYSYQADHELVQIETLAERARYALERGHAQRAKQILLKAAAIEAPYLKTPWHFGEPHIGRAHLDLALAIWIADGDAKSAEYTYQLGSRGGFSCSEYVDYAREVWLGTGEGKRKIQELLDSYAQQPDLETYDSAVHMFDFILNPVGKRKPYDLTAPASPESKGSQSESD